MIAALYFIFFFLIYFPLSIWIIRKSYRFAKARYRRGWAGGVIAAFIMYNLVFWDWIPVVLMHKYLCETEGGFWIYKTPEQWVKEHPEVVGQDWSKYSSFRTEWIRKDYGNTLDRNWYGLYIYTENVHKIGIDFTKTITKHESKLIDVKTGEVLIKSIDFYPVAQYKLWIAPEPFTSSCSELVRYGFYQEFGKLIQLIKGNK